MPDLKSPAVPPFDPLTTAFIAGSLVRLAVGDRPYGSEAPWVVALIVLVGGFGWRFHRAHRRGAGRVLVVDDDGSTCFMLGRFLREKRWQVEVANTAAEALNRLDDRRKPVISWILLDLMLPDQPGVFVLKHAKLLRPSPRVAVLTGRMAGSPEWDEVIGLGADYVLTKTSVGVDELVRLMEAKSE